MGGGGEVPFPPPPPASLGTPNPTLGTGNWNLPLLNREAELGTGIENWKLGIGNSEVELGTGSPCCAPEEKPPEGQKQ